jgi:hypothetical protein
MTDISWSEADLRQLGDEGLTVEQVRGQLVTFERGARRVRLNRPCIPGDGIVVISEKEIDLLVRRYDESVRNALAVKFVPASGAATRMFKDWFRCLDADCFDSDTARAAFAADLKRFAFIEDLRAVIARDGFKLSDLLDQGRYAEIISYILTSKGLHYGQLPKALLKFHAYPGQGSRTALEEHLVEAALYVRDAGSRCRIHFTVSPEHERAVADWLQRVKGRYEKRFDAHYDVEISRQESSTNTIALDTGGRPYRDADGRLVFRPGGHGALLKNLNRIDGDIIFIKNIDNVIPDRLKPATVLCKKMLAGYLILLKEEITGYLTWLAQDRPEEEMIHCIMDFCRCKLCISFPSALAQASVREKGRFLFDKLNRPLRVCGMVRNEGEPGGGPFWVEDPEGNDAQSLQIIEEFQVDGGSAAQRAIWASATHFNPVDLVCAVRDYRMRKFDLNRFVDQQAVCISRKSEKGRDLLALELPGLWNGAMAHWNTVFVEVPIETFNPVKTVRDLLRSQHLPA